MIVKIPEDIFSYEHRVWGNFTKRQLICIGISLVIVLPTFIALFWSTNSVDLAATVAFIAALPVMMCAFWKKDGQYLEQVVWYKLRARFRYPQKRKYAMTNLYEVIVENQKEYDRFNEEINSTNSSEIRKGGKKVSTFLGKTGHRTK